MTAQVSNLAALRDGNRWRIDFVGGGWSGDRGGGGHVHVIDEDDASLADLKLEEVLPGFREHASVSTAGMLWTRQLLGYIDDVAGRTCFVVRPWWGTRLVVDLDALAPVDPAPLEGELDRYERELVRERVLGLEDRADPASERVFCDVEALAYLAGELGLTEAVPVLLELEERIEASGEVWGGYRYHISDGRRVVQRALRILGARPRGFPVCQVREGMRRKAGEVGYARGRPVDGPTRHAQLAGLRSGLSLTELLTRLGGPDEVDGSVPKKRTYLRFDVDVDPATSLMVRMDDKDRLVAATLFAPPFWQGVALRDHGGRTVSHDGSLRHLIPTEELMEAPFDGYRVDLLLVNELAASTDRALAQLARSAQEGGFTALYLLVDALEERGDARAAQVRSWLPARA